VTIISTLNRQAGNVFYGKETEMVFHAGETERLSVRHKKWPSMSVTAILAKTNPTAATRPMTKNTD